MPCFEVMKKVKFLPRNFFSGSAILDSTPGVIYLERASTILRFSSGDVVFDTFMDTQFLHSIVLSFNFMSKIPLLNIPADD